jgi:hypothetical protein
MGIPLKSTRSPYRDRPNVEVTEVTKRPIRQAEIGRASLPVLALNAIYVPTFIVQRAESCRCPPSPQPACPGRPPSVLRCSRCGGGADERRLALFHEGCGRPTSISRTSPGGERRLACSRVMRRGVSQRTSPSCRNSYKEAAINNGYGHKSLGRQEWRASLSRRDRRGGLRAAP